jgi:hypothetical protein
MVNGEWEECLRDRIRSGYQAPSIYDLRFTIDKELHHHAPRISKRHVLPYLRFRGATT